MRSKPLKISTEGVWLPAASGTTSACKFPSEIEKMITISSPGRTIHNRTIDTKYSTAAERPTTKDTMTREKCFARISAGTERQIVSLESKPRELSEDAEFFVQAQFLIASDHRDLSHTALSDDLAVERVLAISSRLQTTHQKVCLYRLLREAYSFCPAAWALRRNRADARSRSRM
jgi:hypothetical protein